MVARIGAHEQVRSTAAMITADVEIDLQIQTARGLKQIHLPEGAEVRSELG